MSEFKVGDKVIVEGHIGEIQPQGVIVVMSEKDEFFFCKAVIRKASAEPVDVFAIRVGDEVTVRAKVIDVDEDDDKLPIRVQMVGGEANHQSWLTTEGVVSHTPRPIALPNDAASRFGSLSDDDKRTILKLLEDAK